MPVPGAEIFFVKDLHYLSSPKANSRHHCFLAAKYTILTDTFQPRFVREVAGYVSSKYMWTMKNRKDLQEVFLHAVKYFFFLPPHLLN